MAGEKFGPAEVGDANNAGEQILSPEERAAMEQEAGSKAIDTINQTEVAEQGPKLERAGDKIEWTPEKLRDLYTSIMDRNGNPYFSKETVDRLVSMGQAADPIKEDRDVAIKRAQDAAYRAAQAEIARILDGRTINKYLTDSRRDMVKLQGEIKRLREGVFNDPLLKKMQERHLADAEGELLAMNRRRKMIENLKNGEKAEPVGSDEYGDFDAVNAELDINQPESATAVKMDLAAFDRMLSLFKDDPEMAAKLLLARQKYLEDAKEENEEAGFASAESGEASDEEVASAAAGEETRGEPAEDNNAESKKERKSKKSGSAKKKDYVETLADAARQTRPGSWMSEEEKAEAAEGRETEVQRVARKAARRKGFKRTVSRALALIGLGTMLMGRAGETTVQAAETVTIEESEEARQVREQAETAATAAQLGLTPAELVQKNLLDYDAVPEQAIRDFGASFYEGFMDRENSQELSNGLRANYTLYESTKNSKNSFGPDQSYIYNMTEGREATERKNLIEMIRDQPQALASFTANYPRMLKACGIDEAVLHEQNLELRAQAVLNMLLGEGGGDLQNKLMGAAAMALNNENTTFDFYLENGLERSFYMKKINPDGPNTPDNIALKTSKVYRDNVPQVQITVTYVDGIQEYSDQNLKCHNQTNMSANTYRKRESVIEVRLDSTVEQVVNAQEQVIGQPTEDQPDDQPEDQPDDTPDDDDGDEEEQPKQKDPENEKKIVDEGGQTNPVDPTPEGDLTEDTTEEEATPSEGNQEQTEAGQVSDATKTEEEQQQDRQNQEEANQNEQLEDMSDDDFLDFVESVLNEADNDIASASEEVSTEQNQPQDNQVTDNTQQTTGQGEQNTATVSNNASS